VTEAILLLLYNLALTGIYAVAAACAYYFYTQKRDSGFVALCVMFCAYLFDNTIVFCTEAIPEFATLYDTLFLLAPSVKTIYFVTLMASMVYALQKGLNALSMKSLLVILGVYTAILISAPMIPENNWKVFIYYLPTQLLMIGLALWGLGRLKKLPDLCALSSFSFARRTLLFLLICAIFILAEDTIVIFYFDIFAAAGLKINNRNVSENILFLGLAFCLIRETVKQLSLDSPRSLSEALPNTLFAEKSPAKLFCIAYGLTDRESEIFQRLLDGKSQQEISDELFIALGTVKTHIHNVYQKTDAANRSRLIEQFQTFRAQLASGAPDAENPS